MAKMDEEELCMIQAEGPLPGSLWMHRKGHLCRVVANAINESTLAPLVVYEHNGLRWARPRFEFLDGRFTEVK